MCIHILATQNTNDSSVMANSTKHRKNKNNTANVQQFIHPGVASNVQLTTNKTKKHKY